MPTAEGKLTVNAPEVTSNAKSSTPKVVVDEICLVGKVIPPKEIKPLRTTNSFAIFVFFFHYPKEKIFYVYYPINIISLSLIFLLQKKNPQIFFCGF